MHTKEITMKAMPQDLTERIDNFFRSNRDLKTHYCSVFSRISIGSTTTVFMNGLGNLFFVITVKNNTDDWRKLETSVFANEPCFDETLKTINEICRQYEQEMYDYHLTF